MDRIGLALDQTTNDLFLRDDGTLAVVRDTEAVGHHVRHRLKTFEGEWFLDVNAGVPWLTDIFAKKYDPALAESVVKGEIMNTDGVTEITSFSVLFDRTPRNLIIRDVEVLTEYDIRTEI